MLPQVSVSRRTFVEQLLQELNLSYQGAPLESLFTLLFSGTFEHLLVITQGLLTLVVHLSILRLGAYGLERRDGPLKRLARQ